MFDWIVSPEAWVSLVTLTALEIVLGIDNIIFIAILCNKLEKEKRSKARIIGLAFAMITRIILLLSLFWIMKLTKPLFTIFGFGISGRDIVLIVGGLFLIIKSALEIYHSAVDSAKDKKDKDGNVVSHSLFATVIQIGILDIIFSLDSVITAVGMANHIEIMILAVIIAVCVMMFASGFIADFVDNNPTIKILALAFLILVGISLVLEGASIHISKSYIYFAMGFSLAVELINIYIQKKSLKSKQ